MGKTITDPVPFNEKMTETVTVIVSHVVSLGLTD